METIDILQEHGITYQLEGDHILARDDYGNSEQLTFRWVDVTRWSVGKLFIWLGY